MKYRILTGVVGAPLLIVLTTTPAYALFGSILAGIQRAQMIANQGVQIYKDILAKITFDGQLTQMTDQFAHLKEQALGGVGALTDPFTDLASVPTQFIGVGLSWKNDFTGIAQGVASSVENMGETGKSFRESWAQRLTDADTVAETDILDLYADYRPEIAAEVANGYLAARAPFSGGKGSLLPAVVDALVLKAVAWVAARQAAQRHRPRHEPQIGVRFAGPDQLVHLIGLGEVVPRLG